MLLQASMTCNLRPTPHDLHVVACRQHGRRKETSHLAAFVVPIRCCFVL